MLDYEKILKQFDEQSPDLSQITIADDTEHIANSLESFQRQMRYQYAEYQTQKAKDSAQRIADRKQDRCNEWIIGIVSACCGSVLTLIIEHFEELLIAFGKLFH